MTELADSTFVRHVPCETCNSPDNGALYSDGHVHCHKCGAHTDTESDQLGPADVPSNEFVQANDWGPLPAGLPSRGLTAATLDKFGYGTVRLRDGRHQAARYPHQGGVAYKVRRRDKTFSWLGNAKAVRGLYGQHLWRDRGRFVTITEGEHDAHALSQVLGNKWPVVSVKNGCGSADKDIMEALEWLSGFEYVVLMLDNDEAGREAAERCAMVLPAGMARIAVLPLKDSNEMLLAGRSAELVDAMWGAKVWRPDGIITGAEVLDHMNRPVPPHVDYPFSELQAITRGLRQNEITMFCGGSGSGKSSLVRQIALGLAKAGHNTGIVALEESVQETALILAGQLMGTNGQDLLIDPAARDELSARRPQDWAGAAEFLGARMPMYDHWGSLEDNVLLSRIEYMVRVLGCEYVVLDHISIVVSGTHTRNERKTIDVLMTGLGSLVQRTKCGLLIITHLNRSDERWESGAMPHLSNLRGSGALEQLSWTVIGAARNLEAPDDAERSTLRLAVLKNRRAGRTGPAGALMYDDATGLLNEVDLALAKYDGMTGPAEVARNY